MKICDWCVDHAHALLYVGGAATVVAGKAILKSNGFRKACVATVANGIKTRRTVESYVQDVKDEAMDICYDAAEMANMEVADAE